MLEEITEEAEEPAEAELPVIEEITEEAEKSAEAESPVLEEITEEAEESAEAELPVLEEITEEAKESAEAELPEIINAINTPEISPETADISLSMLSDFDEPVTPEKKETAEMREEPLPMLSDFAAPEPAASEEPVASELPEEEPVSAEEPAEPEVPEESGETEAVAPVPEPAATEPEPQPAEPEILEIPDLVPMGEVQIPGMHIGKDDEPEQMLDIPDLAPIGEPEETIVEKIEIPEDGKFTVKECRKQYHGESAYTIPFGYREIRAGACAALDDLESLVVSDTVTKIGNGAFSDCASLKSVYIPLSVVDIGEDAFDGCDALEKVTIPHRFEENIEDMFPENVEITWLEDAEPQTVVSGNGRYTAKIRMNEYDGSPLLKIPEGYREIRSGACAGLEDVTELVLPESLTKICAGAFADCTGLENLAIPAGVTVLEEGAFEGCTGLKLVALPPHLEEEGRREFPQADLFFLD